MNDIGIYEVFRGKGLEGKSYYKENPDLSSITNTGGVLWPSGHEHEGDRSYETSYTRPGSKWPFVKVEVTQHAGSDSDQWLLHEIEDIYRWGDYDEDMIPARFRNIDGNNIFYTKLGGRLYMAQ